MYKEWVKWHFKKKTVRGARFGVHIRKRVDQAWQWLQICEEDSKQRGWKGYVWCPSGASAAVVLKLEGASESPGGFLRHGLQAIPPECLVQ